MLNIGLLFNLNHKMHKPKNNHFCLKWLQQTQNRETSIHSNNFAFSSENKFDSMSSKFEENNFYFLKDLSRKKEERRHFCFPLTRVN